MALRTDLHAASARVRRLLAARRTRIAAARERSSHPAPAPGTIEIVVSVADAPGSLDTLRRWARPLAQLAKRHRVAIVARDPSTALAAWRETDLPVIEAEAWRDLERFVVPRSPAIVLAVGRGEHGFGAAGAGRIRRVAVDHGAVDTTGMSAAELEAADVVLVAGQAAIDRLGRGAVGVPSRAIIPIGRPPVDHLGGEAPFVRDDRIVVLYAPTWEGAHPAEAYGSLGSHGRRLVDALLSTGRHRLVYRPHRCAGRIDPAYGAAHRDVLAAIARANAADPEAGHVIDADAELGWPLAVADVAIADISEVVDDRLAIGKPVVITRPATSRARIDERGYLGSAEWLTVDAARDVVAILDRVLIDEAGRARLAHWSRHHFGGTAPGAATRRFIAAIDTVLDAGLADARPHATADGEAMRLR